MSETPRIRRGLRLLAILLIPVFLAVHAPLLAAVVPGALLTVASLQARDLAEPRPSLQLVAADDLDEITRVVAAERVIGQSRRLA